MKEYIVHSGVLKMKWGARRYQNPDGTWTEEGKRRRREQEKVRNSLSSLSDEELMTGIKRMQLEDQYRTLNSKLHPQKQHRGRKIAMDLLEKAVMSIGGAAIDNFSKNLFKTAEKPKRTDVMNMTPERLAKMNDKDRSEALAALKEYNAGLANIKSINNATKSEFENELSSVKVMDSSKFAKIEKEYFDKLGKSSPNSSENRYYAWLGERAVYNR